MCVCVCMCACMCLGGEVLKCMVLPSDTVTVSVLGHSHGLERVGDQVQIHV